MNFSFLIAKRYFSTAKKNSITNIISWVSFFGVLIGTAALIIVLSVFNGFEKLVLDMYNSFDPDLKIESKEGKTFDVLDLQEVLSEHKSIEYYAYVLQEKALLKYKDHEFIANIKGVSEEYLNVTRIDSLLVDGVYFDNQSTNVAVIGSGIAYYLSVYLLDMFEHIKIYIPNRSSNTLLNYNTAFKQSFVLPVGVFDVQPEINDKYIITPIKFLQELIKKENQASSVEIKLKNENNYAIIQKEIINIIGDKYIIKNRFQQQEFLYKILNTEKLAVFLILFLIVVIATFNIVGSLSMLILEKKKDIKTLSSLGLKDTDLPKVFFYKGLLTVFSGTIFGLLTGSIFVILQNTFGIISLGEGNFVIDNYPAILAFEDILIVFLVVLFIGIIASWYPAKILVKRILKPVA